ncbi:MAG: FAD-dependent oxidoreductase [Phycisphaerales bacterium]
MQRVETASVHWTNQGPVDPVSGDRWCDARDPLGEVRHVFLAGNDLAARWAPGGSAWAGDRRHLTIGEIGFGAGRNALVAALAFVRGAPRETRLHIVSFERAPMRVDDARRVLAWVGEQNQEHVGPGARGASRGDAGRASDESDWSSEVAALLDQWPAAVAGIHPVWLAGGRVRLLVVAGEVAETLPRMAMAADAWFLDGFAPSRDGSAWTPEVMAAIGAASRASATAATWSAAGTVRDSLVAAGFEVDRGLGHGGKRNMIRARRTASAGAGSVAAAVDAEAGWAAADEPRRDAARPRRAIVAGAGLAGSAAAASLADRGWAVTVLDPAGVAGETSSVPRAIVEPVFGRRDSAALRLRWTGFRLVAAESRQIDAEAAGRFADPGRFVPAPVVHAAVARWTEIERGLGPEHPVLTAVGPQAAADRLGVPQPGGGYAVPGSGWLDAAARCRWRVDRAEIGVEPRAFTAADGSADPEAIVIDATGTGAAWAALGGDAFPIEAARGQVARWSTPPPWAELVGILSGRTSVIPAESPEADLLLASTYDHHDADAATRASDDAVLLEQLAATQPELAAALGDHSPLDRWAGVRRTGHDRLPIVDLIDGRAAGGARVGLSLAHGSRGVIGGALAAELLAARLEGEPWPAFVDDAAAIASDRRSIRRRQQARRDG